MDSDERTFQELRRGVTSDPAYIPEWYHYDEEGSRLFDLYSQQCKWYYFPKSELQLLESKIKEISSHFYNLNTLVDLGSGNASKTRHIIDVMLHIHSTLTYIPVDISDDYLMKSVNKMKQEYGSKLDIEPIGAEFLQAFQQIKILPGAKLIIWIGGGPQNLPYVDQIYYLSEIANVLRDNDRLMITLDVTDPTRKTEIELAYLDPDDYNKKLHFNAIHRINREMNADIDLSKFSLKANFVKNTSTDGCSFVEKWLEATQNCTVDFGRLNVIKEFQKGDKLYLHHGEGETCKYTLQQINKLCRKASLDIVDCWTNDHIAIVLLSRK